MSVQYRAATPGRPLTGSLQSWRSAVSLAAVTAGIAIVTGCLLPWITAFAGLVTITGVRGSNGRLLAAAGVLVMGTGLWHLARGGPVSRWLTGLAGVAVTLYSGALLLRLSASVRAPGTDSMMLLSAGPGLWVVAGGGLLAFATLFLPASEQTTLRATVSGGPRASWAADFDTSGPRRWLQITLGLAWLVDAALQFQPYMFTHGLVTQIIEPAAMGSPAVLSNSVLGTSQIIQTHVAVFNAIFATGQLALAAGLLWRRTSRGALAGSIAWALAIWWLGEGLGGLLTGSASPVTGAPGAALLYAAIAILAWPAKTAGQPGIAASSRLGVRGAHTVWIVLWALSSYLMIRLASRPGGLRAVISAQASGEPGPIAAIDHRVATAIGSASTAICISLGLLFLIIAAGVLIRAITRPALVLAIVAGLAMWVIGQNFGAILTGRGTDPGTGPALIALAVAYWPRRQACAAAVADPAESPPATAVQPCQV